MSLCRRNINYEIKIIIKTQIVLKYLMVGAKTSNRKF